MFAFLAIFFLFAALYLGFLLTSKSDKIKQKQVEIDKLKRTVDEMDEQAKLVVRTDIELNKTQEELDKKIIGLYVLQKISRSISTSLEERWIYKSIEMETIKELGFEKSLAFSFDKKEGGFVTKINLGYPENELEKIETFLGKNQEFWLNFITREKTFSSFSLPEGLAVREEINGIFKISAFVISPILAKEGNKGFLLVGTESLDVPITEGDEELITILANQLGQSLENARLFEKTWRAQQELEKRVEERTHELTQALEEKEKISKRKSDFVSSVAHELRAPLTSIKGYAAILSSGKLGILPEDARLRIEKLNKHSDELVQLVNDLLDIARIESGKVTMRQEPAGLKKIIEETIDLLSVQCKEKQIELSSHLGEEIPNVLVDLIQIKRVFINLINNAIRFTPKNGQINVFVHKIIGGIQIDISDTGCGIPADALEKIFNEFYRVDNAINMQVKGTGLGLALVKNIIEAHKGKTWVKSKLGEGSTFSFTLPHV
ncbi:MAG: HAMP domain-containing sensor histidine kinase [Candidatus Omnitrophota bacterium]